MVDESLLRQLNWPDELIAEVTRVAEDLRSNAAKIQGVSSVEDRQILSTSKLSIDAGAASSTGSFVLVSTGEVIPVDK